MIQEDISIRPLSAALRKKAEEELNETPEKIVTGLKTLRDWIETQPDLPTMKVTNQWLVAFLRGSKHDVEKAKRMLKSYALCKKTMSDFYGNRDPFDPEMQELLKVGAFVPLPKTNIEDAPRLILVRLGHFSQIQTKGTPADFVKICLLSREILMLEDDNFVVAGDDSICDLLGLAFKFMIQITPSVAKRTMTAFEKTLSIRIKNTDIVNPPYGVSFVLTLLKMFMSAKAKERLRIHSENPCGDYYDKSILPEEYGGTAGPLQNHIDHWKAKVESYRDWFVDENSDSK